MKNFSLNIGLLFLFFILNHGILAADGLPSVKCVFQNGYWVITVSAGNSDIMDALKEDNSQLNPTRLGQKGLEETLSTYIQRTVKVRVDSTDLSLKAASVELNSAGGTVQLISQRREYSGCEISVECRTFEHRSEPIVKAVFRSDQVKDVKFIHPEEDWVANFDLSQLLETPCN